MPITDRLTRSMRHDTQVVPVVPAEDVLETDTYMLIQVNTDNHITGRESLTTRVEATVESALDRFSDRITRVELHLSDENGRKTGPDDKRCVMEVRVEGRQPVAVTHMAPTVDEAVSGAADKMTSALDSTLGRLRGY